MEKAGLQLHILRRDGRAANLLSVLLPPLCLYAALAAVLCPLFGVTEEWLALLPGAVILCIVLLLPRGWAWALRAVSILGAVCAFALLPAVRNGGMALANRLFATSEAVNAYAYFHFAVAEGENPASIRAALSAAALLLGVISSLAGYRLCLALLFISVASLEAYFGVMPGAWRNLLLFSVLSLLFANGGREVKNGVILLVGIALVTLIVFLLCPHPIGAVEARSEEVRDTLGSTVMSMGQPSAPPEAEKNRTHQESRQHQELTRQDESREGTWQEFARETEQEQEISLPHRTDWLRIILLLLLVVALLLGPFLPFLLLTRARRRTEEKLAEFSVPDNAAAIRAMFLHVMDWLQEGGLKTENRPFSAYERAVEELLGGQYAERFRVVLPLWQEAAYSTHAMSDEQRLSVKELLDMTAAKLYEQANRRARLRIKYLACLCGSERHE